MFISVIKSTTSTIHFPFQQPFKSFQTFQTDPKVLPSQHKKCKEKRKTSAQKALATTS